MKNQTIPSSAADRLIVRGIHLELTEALKNAVESKCEKLFRHQERIIRIRVDLEHDKLHKGKPRFIAKGHIEIGGPDMIVSITDEDAYKAIDLMTQKLDRRLRVRAAAYKKKRLHPRAVELPVELPKVAC
jgi:putative sigma-54 modulation protein